ncbi:MAG TPA: YceI family protein [Bacteroidota bacterium]|nr:YceI family protein [Bacteroidota bacterium]
MKTLPVLGRTMPFLAPIILLGILELFVLPPYWQQAALARQQNLTALKDGSSLSYHLTHPLHEIDATSKDIDCTISYDEATQTIQATTFSADVTTFDSGNSNRDSHAMEVLDALTYPTVSFASKLIKSNGNDLDVSGDLTFHGQTKPVEFSASKSIADGKLTVSGKADVSLTAFGIERPSLLMIPVQDTLRISFTVLFPVQGK